MTKYPAWLILFCLTGCSLWTLEQRREYTELENYYLNLDFQKACPLALKEGPKREANTLMILYDCLRKEPETLGVSQNSNYPIRILKEFVDRKDTMVFSELGRVYSSGDLGVKKSTKIADCWSDLNGHEENIENCIAISPELSGLKYIDFVVDENGDGVKIK